MQMVKVANQKNVWLHTISHSWVTWPGSANGSLERSFSSVLIMDASRCQGFMDLFLRRICNLSKHGTGYTSYFFRNKTFFVCQDRKLKFSATVWFRISWNLAKFQLIQTTFFYGEYNLFLRKLKYVPPMMFLIKVPNFSYERNQNRKMGSNLKSTLLTRGLPHYAPVYLTRKLERSYC